MILPQLEQALRSSSISACSTQRRSDSGATPSSSATARNGATRPAAEGAAADLLAALGVELDAEHLREMPRRVAQAYAELLTPRPFNSTTFPNDERYDELVVVDDIRFQSPVRTICSPCAAAGGGAAGPLEGDPHPRGVLEAVQVEVRLGLRDDASAGPEWAPSLLPAREDARGLVGDERPDAHPGASRRQAHFRLFSLQWAVPSVGGTAYGWWGGFVFSAAKGGWLLLAVYA
jgi:hypothetical protein